ncbi:MAG: beta-ketoacyl-ACP synthase III [Gemmatimonadota bacterium]|nr:beta-ketoacyl-ACP synthase III [Gemmatimonadota bacterium]
MPRTAFLSTGFYVPERVVTNAELETYMDTSDEWIRQRSGIEERHWAAPGEGGSDMAKVAAERALERAGMEAGEIDCIVLATLSPDHFFPGTGVFLQRKLGIAGVPCLDIRNQCTGFLYGLEVADAFIRTGQYGRILLVGTEIHSTGLQVNTEGRDTAVLFGDGAGAAILGPTDEPGRGVLAVRTHADGAHAEKLWAPAPACREKPFVSKEMIDAGLTRPFMEGREVFKHAVVRMPEAVEEVLAEACLSIDDVRLLIPHQANLRIAELVQRRLGLPDDRVYNNIMRYGNTTAASIPIALAEAEAEGRIAGGDLVALTAFGSGFTWGGALVRW